MKPGASASSRPPPEPVLVHRHVVVLADGAEQVARFVCCPREGTTVSLRDCASCGRSRGVVEDARLERLVVDCGLAPLEATSVLPEHTWTRAGDPLRAAPVEAAMCRDVTCVMPDTALDHVARTLEEEGIGSVVVVDESHRVVGIVSAHDLARVPPAPDRVARDAMTPRPLAVSQHLMLTRAAAIMAFEGFHHLVVVDDVGKLAGVVSSIDVLRYLGQAGGALIPPAPSKRRAAGEG
jgi:CBS domain-containing protein